MRKWLPVFAAVICCALIAGCAAGFSVEEAAPADELEHLVRRMELAVNPGKNAIPDRFRIFFRTHIRGLGVTMNGNLVQEKEPFRLCNQARMPGMPATVELYDGKQGWTIIEGMSLKELEGAELKQLQFLGKMNLAADLRQYFDPLVLDRQPVEINGKKCFRLVGIPAEFPEFGTVELLVDPETALIDRRRYSVTTIFGKIPVEVNYLEYRKYGNWILPAVSVTSTLQEEVETTVEAVDFDPAVAPGIWEVKTWYAEEENQ
ncbi:MAG: hypothetical protein J6R85_03705 [Lentisphaeria bacterium]|nr:hypothetical protein [Lentisphaeria bacterium]